MYCSNCGKQIDDSAKFCSVCGKPTGNHAAGDDAISQDRETVIKEGLCNRVVSAIYVQNGHGLLTNKRFIYSKHSFAKTALIGAFVNLTKGDYDFEIPVSNMKQILNGRQGLSKTIIIQTKTGDEYNFYFTDRQVWEIEFANAIRQYKSQH